MSVLFGCISLNGKITCTKRGTGIGFFVTSRYDRFITWLSALKMSNKNLKIRIFGDLLQIFSQIRLKNVAGFRVKF